MTDTTGATDGGNDTAKANGTGNDSQKNAGQGGDQSKATDAGKGTDAGAGQDMSKITLDAKEYENMQKTIKESQKLINSYEKAKKDATNADLMEKGKFEELLKTNNAELERIASEKSKADEENAKLKGIVSTVAKNRLTSFEKTHGKEKLDAIKAIVGDDEIALLGQLDNFEKLVGTNSLGVVDKQGQPAGKGADRLATLREQAQKGLLSAKDAAEYMKLSAEARNK